MVSSEIHISITPSTLRETCRRRKSSRQLDIDGMCNARRLSASAGKDLLSSSAAPVRAGLLTVEPEEGPNDDSDGTRPAPRADHRRVDRHGDRGDFPPTRDARPPSRGAPVPRALPRRGARGRPWRRRRAGASSSRSCSASAPRRTWPSRRKPRPVAAPRSAPSPTAPTPVTCASC